MILLLDNYDSFTYNLYQAVRALGAECRVVRNDVLSVRELLALKPKGLILSPGPGRPEDAGVLVEFIRRAPASLPILGVCLGHQATALAYGGRVVRARHLMHGKTCRMTHDGKGVFVDMAQNFPAGRYHSLIADLPSDGPLRATVARYHSLVASEPLPEGLYATARAEDGSLMGLRHRERPIEGVQFHPESIATPLGAKMLKNFIAGTRSRHP